MSSSLWKDLIRLDKYFLRLNEEIKPLWDYSPRDIRMYLFRDFLIVLEHQKDIQANVIEQLFD